MKAASERHRERHGEDFSNKTLIILLTIVLVVIVVGTTISTRKISQMGGDVYDLVTGAPSFSFGEANVTVSSITSLSLVGGNGTVISFGTGYVNGSCDFCQMDTNGVFVSGYANGSNLSGAGQTQCCTTFTTPSAGFLIENEGNVNLSVGYTCSGNCTFESFIGGDRAKFITGNGLEIKVTANSVAAQGGEAGATDTVSSCQGGGILFRDSGWNITNSSAYIGDTGSGRPSATYTALSSIGHYLCGNGSNYPLMPDNNKDAAVVDLNITILYTSGIGGGRSSFRLTFNGTSAG